MDATNWLVIALGVASIAWVNWYFFLAQRSEGQAAIVAAGGVPEITIAVEGGYEPATIRVSPGTPVRLVFDRRETGSCSEEVVFPEFGIRKFLPAFQKTTVEVTPPAPGRYEFTCGMGMLRGSLIAGRDGA